METQKANDIRAAFSEMLEARIEIARLQGVVQRCEGQIVKELPRNEPVVIDPPTGPCYIVRLVDGRLSYERGTTLEAVDDVPF